MAIENLLKCDGCGRTVERDVADISDAGGVVLAEGWVHVAVWEWSGARRRRGRRICGQDRPVLQQEVRGEVGGEAGAAAEASGGRMTIPTTFSPPSTHTGMESTPIHSATFLPPCSRMISWGLSLERTARTRKSCGSMRPTSTTSCRVALATPRWTTGVRTRPWRTASPLRKRLFTRTPRKPDRDRTTEEWGASQANPVTGR